MNEIYIWKKIYMDRYTLNLGSKTRKKVARFFYLKLTGYVLL